MTVGRDPIDTDVEGRTPHDSAVSATRPNLSGLEARTTNPTAVADGDVVRGMADDLGKTITWASAPRDLLTTHYTSCSVSTTMTFATDPSAGVFRDVIWFSMENSTGVLAIVNIFDKTVTGTIVWGPIDLNINGTYPRAFGCFNPPWPAAAAATGWGIDSTETAVNGTMLCADSV